MEEISRYLRFLKWDGHQGNEVSERNTFSRAMSSVPRVQLDFIP